MKRKVSLHNLILKATACAMGVALFVSVICVQVDSWWPVPVCFVSSLWLGLYCYANGVMDDYYGGDE